jgi:copper transport protein
VRTLVHVLLVVTAWLVASAPPAAAHAELIVSIPANGAHLATAPTEVELRFSEPVNLVRDGFALLDQSGRPIDTPTATAQSTQVRMPLPADLGDGVYSITWRVVSVDSHPVHGALVFSVGAARAAPLAGAATRTDADGAVATAFWLLRWIGFGAIALLIGGVFFLVVCWRPDRRAAAVIRPAWVVAIVATAGTLLLQGVAAAGAPLSAVFDPALLADTMTTNFGILVSARLVVLAIAGTMLNRRNNVAAAVVAVALAATWSATGHAVAGTWPVLAVALDMVHVLAMSVWIGGLVLLCVCVLPRSRLQARKGERAQALARFSRVALVSVAVLLVSGGLLALRTAGMSGLLSGSSYASLIVFKAGGFGVLLWLAAMSRSAVRRNAGVHIRRSATAEIAVGAAVLAVSAVLVATPPNVSTSPQPVAQASGPYLAALPTPTGDVQVWVSPALTGENQIVVNVRDEQGIDLDVPEVTGQLSLPANGIGPLPLPLAGTGPGQYIADPVTVPTPGTAAAAVRS